MNYKEVQKRYDDTFSVREVEESAKDDEGKPRLSLVSPYLIEAVGRVRTYGTENMGIRTAGKKLTQNGTRMHF